MLIQNMFKIPESDKFSLKYEHKTNYQKSDFLAIAWFFDFFSNFHNYHIWIIT